jgi:predicted RNA-binding Zn ribbon-like protein
MDFRHYTDNAAALAAALVNVYADADEVGRPVAPSELDAVLEAHESRGPVRPADVEPLRALAGRLRAVFAAPDPHVAARTVNDLLRDASVTPNVSEHDGLDPHLHFAPRDAGLVERTAANTAMGLAVVLCDYGQERLGVCAATTCEDVFIDTSRNAQRRYCSEGCANRSNVAAHRARRRETAPGARLGAPQTPGGFRSASLPSGDTP